MTKGWTFSERSPDDDGYSAERQKATDVADSFRRENDPRCTTQTPEMVGELGSSGYTVFNILPELVGRPWDNMAFNFVSAYSKHPEVVAGGPVTLDSRPGRVRVFLEHDDRTILRIEWEVEVNLVGCRFGADVRLDNSAKAPRVVDTIVNARAVAAGTKSD